METVALRRRPAPAHAGAPLMPHGKLRVALVADSALQPSWAVNAFAAMEHCSFAAVVAVVELDVVPRQPLPWVLQAYCRLDKWAFGLDPDPLEPVELKTRLPHCPYVKADSRSTEWQRRLRALEIDVLFALGEVDAGRLGGIARYGVWRYCFGSLAEHDSLAGIDELIMGAPVMPSGVKAALAPGEPERLLYQSWSRIFTFSLARTRDNLLPKASQFAERVLKLLHQRGEAWLHSCAPIERSAPGRAKRITSEECLGLAAVLGGRVARVIQQRIYVGQWFLAYRFGATPSCPGDFRNFNCMLPPKDRFWADPFPLRWGGRYWIFFEELMFARGKAHISVVEIDRDGALSAPVKVLERSYHLSYPFLVEHGGALFMIPETGGNRSVEVYRCKRFPDEWTLESELLRDGFYTDATLHRVQDRWWLFANLSPEGTQGSDELNLFHADDLFGPWKPHRQNPVKSDVRGARPAGRLYEDHGRLYRPGQIGAPIYGSGVSINQVLRLTPEDYLETEVERVLPSHPKEVLGIHTLNRSAELMAVDGFTRRPRMWDSLAW